jgi:glucose/arabinose dehydrogenase
MLLASATVATPQTLQEFQEAKRRGGVACDPDNGGLTLPPGFCALVVAEDVGRARHIAVRRNGDIYVAVNPARDGSDPGALVALRDTDRDGRVDVRETIETAGGSGLALSRDGRFLFFGQPDRVLRYRLIPGELLPDGPAETVVSGLPADGDHTAKTVALGPRGGLFVNHGSASNSCQVDNRAVESPGVDPCPELEVRAGVWVYRANETDQTRADGVRFATGLRNANALGFDGFGRLWGVQNGRDQLHENWPALFTPEDDTRKPAEELVRIDFGLDNGWPYCYEDPTKPGKVLAPEYGGDGSTRGRCRTVRQSALRLPAHWAPLSIAFYHGWQFPWPYFGDAFVATHGARFPAPPEGPGYNVLRVRFEHGRPVRWDVFADGFTGGATNLPEEARDRPVGLAVGGDGSLYVSSDQLPGRIWRIVYRPR